MARFEINRPITTAESTVTVDAGLPVGRHRFRLVVIGGRRQPSAPDEAIVDIQRLVIDLRPPIGPVIDPRPPSIEPRPGVVSGPAIITGPIASPSPRRTRGRREKVKKEKP
jgi:hypothetical protein